LDAYVQRRYSSDLKPMDTGRQVFSGQNLVQLLFSE